MYRTILVPLDGSKFAEHALPTAVHLAASAKAPLLLIRVHHRPSHVGSKWHDFLRDEELAYLERLAVKVTQGQSIDVETALLDGDVVEAIGQCAEQRAECLIVMTTHGRTGVSRAWLGSVADGVLRQSTQPVLTLRVNTPERVSLATTIGRVVVPLDGSWVAEQVVPHAVQLALHLPASMTLLRVIEPAYSVMPGLAGADGAVMAEDPVEDSEQDAKSYIQEIAAGIRRKYAAIDVRTDVRIADSAARAIVEHACTGGGALVALATRGRGASRLVVGSVADKVIRAAGDGVLLIRPVRDAS